MKKVFYKTITKDSLKSITYKDIKDLDGYLGRAINSINATNLYTISADVRESQGKKISNKEKTRLKKLALKEIKESFENIELCLAIVRQWKQKKELI
tara:strand:- start:1070 stop:1360 length:291 start_codon:yes stop_codon:yes gene_type:complete